MYTYRETIPLGNTDKSRQEIKDILARLRREWQGPSYDLLQRNCCHFCEELCAALRVASPPAWLNRFAQGADATVKFTNEASAWFKRFSTSVSLTAQQNAQWFREVLLSNQGAAGRTPSQAALDAADECTPGPQSVEPGQAQAPAPGPGPYAREPHSEGAFGADGSARDHTLGPLASGSGSEVTVESSGPSGALRLVRKLPRFAQAAGGGRAGSGLPPSTSAASEPEPPGSPSRLAGVREAAQAHTARLASAVRQKLQELEATAGDGTKQFLFGLIKTRQSRLDDDDPPEPATGREGKCAPGVGASVGALDVPVGAPSVAPTQPPALQVISDSLLPPEVIGAPTASSAEPHGVAVNVARCGSAPHLLDL